MLLTEELHLDTGHLVRTPSRDDRVSSEWNSAHGASQAVCSLESSLMEPENVVSSLLSKKGHR
jgi:hypothetical protein